VVLAPTHKIFTPAFNAASTWAALATSVVTGNPVSFPAWINHFNPSAPEPSYWPGLVRGFQIPARSACTLPVAASCLAVMMVCSSVSALQGPLMMIGLFSAGNQLEIG